MRVDTGARDDVIDQQIMQYLGDLQVALLNSLAHGLILLPTSGGGRAVTGKPLKHHYTRLDTGQHFLPWSRP
jgi:hypothetical protein